MKLKKLVAGMAAAGGGLIILTTVLFKDEIHDWLFAIRRVRTWGDLLAQKPIRLSDGVIVRLGIEDTRCPQGSGVLLYCLAEGYEPKSTRKVGDDSLGPLEVRIVGEGEGIRSRSAFARKGMMQLHVLGQEVLDRLSSTPLLFVRPVLPPRSGKHRVTVSEGLTELGHVSVEGTHDSLHPWMIIERSPKLERLLKEGEGGCPRGIVPGGGRVALPSWRGYVPYTGRSNAKDPLDTTRPLPRLLPEAAAQPELDLRKEADCLVLTSKSKLRVKRENFAARWWVNGLPHVLHGVRGREVYGGLEPAPEYEFQFALDFDASRLEARAGDRVSFQLLYSDQGWIMADGDEWFSLSSEEHRVLESNRVEVTVP